MVTRNFPQAWNREDPEDEERQVTLGRFQFAPQNRVRQEGTLWNKIIGKKGLTDER